MWTFSDEAMMRQIVDAPPVPFAERGMTSWPKRKTFSGASARTRRSFRLGTAFADALSAAKPRGQWACVRQPRVRWLWTVS